MTTVVLDVKSLSEGLDDVSALVWAGRSDPTPRISFETADLLWKILTAKRWQLLKAMAGAGPLTIREAARRVGRDVKSVHGDVQALLNAGLLEKTNRRIEFPYDAIHVDFMLRAA